MIDRASILNNGKLPRAEVLVPEWGGPVLVRSLTAGERDQYELSVRRDREGGKPPRVRARLVVFSVIDEGGNQVFQPGDVEAVAGLPAGPVDRIFDACARLSGLLPSDVEVLEKNSGTVRSANGYSG